MTLRLTAAAALSLLVAAPASAQKDDGGIASATVSAMSIADGVSASIAGSMGYRFNPIVALGIELTFVPRLTPDIHEIPIPLLSAYEFNGVSYPGPAITIRGDGGHATLFTTNLRLTIPTRSRRISPYFIGGAGAGTVTDELHQTIVYPPIRLAVPSSPIVVFPLPPPVSQSIARTTTDFVATLGGGVSLLTGDHWAFDVDARYVGLLGSRDLHIGRYGGGISYRF